MQRVSSYASIPVPDFEIPSGLSRVDSTHRLLQSDQDEKFTEYLLPCFSGDGIMKRITPQTMVDVINGIYDGEFNALIVIDARFPYEYDGGHIPEANNIRDPEVIRESLFDEVIDDSLIVVHCEFSQNRGPKIASIIREIDSELNYPNLQYPNIYVLDGGYKRFYEEFPDYCDGGYISMSSEPYKSNGDLVRYNSEYKEYIERYQEEKLKRAPLVELPHSSNLLQSPMQCLGSQSPTSAKRLNFIASPVVKRH